MDWLYSSWNSPGQNTGVGSHSLCQGIFPAQGPNPGLPHCTRILYQLSHKGSPRILEWVAYPFSRGSSKPGIKPGSPALQVILYQLSYQSWDQHKTTHPTPLGALSPFLTWRELLSSFSAPQDNNTLYPAGIRMIPKYHKYLSVGIWRPILSVHQFSVGLLATPWTIAPRPPCLSPTPRTCSNACSSSQWCHPTISSSLIPFSSCLQSFLASGSFLVSQFFTSGCQSIGASASALPISIQDWFPLGWTGLIYLQSKGLKSLLQHHSWKASVLRHSAFFMVQLSKPYMTTGKTIALTIWTFVGKGMSLLFNMLSRLVITFLLRSKCLLISWV